MKVREGRVLVVDDSPYVRRFLREVLSAEPGVGVIDGAANGRTALAKAVRSPPDLVTLDLHMPVMDGFTFLRLFRARSRAPVLVVSSHADLGNVERALSLGATGFITKPEDPYRGLDAIAEEVRLKVRQALGRPRGRREARAAKAAPAVPPPDFPVVAIGSSSGGPPTLQYLLSSLPQGPGCAVLIAQHMPPGFTESFARRLDRLLDLAVEEAEDGGRVAPGRVLVAPGGRHMALREGPGGPRVVLERPGDDLYVPSVDRLLETSARVLGQRLTAVILTGMGRDGARGVREVRARGGRVIAESRETAAIWGMPREAAATGCVDEVLPLPQIAVRLIRVAGGGGRGTA